MRVPPTGPHSSEMDADHSMPLTNIEGESTDPPTSRPLREGQNLLQKGWKAHLSVKVGRRHGRSRIMARRHEGPLLIQKPFYPRGHDSCQIILVHPPGGIVGGDRLRIDVEVGEMAHALITTPGATRFYKSAGPQASQHADLRLAQGACLEWTPQETLLYDASESRISTQVHMKSDSRFLGWDIYGLGRPAAKSHFSHGRCEQSFSLFRSGRPLWIERNQYQGGGESLDAAWGLAGYTTTGTLVCTGCGTESLAKVRGRIESLNGQRVRLAATLRADLMIVRGLASQTRTLLDCFSSLREHLLPSASPAARIWAT